MRIKTTFAFIVLLFLSCSKEDYNNTKLDAIIPSNDAVIIDPYNIPIDEIGPGTFMDSIGGLYPDGTNAASGTYANDLFATSQSIVPIDTFGVPGTSSKLSKIAFISLGGSTGGHNMKSLKDKTTGNPLTNPKLLLLSCNNGTGDASINSIMNPNDLYWNHVTQIIKGGKSSYRQVQVIYLETEDSTRYVAFPGRPNVVKQELETCLRVLKQKFPNIKVVYNLARTRTFQSTALWNREPSPYYWGWAMKWAVQDQINGVPGTEYKGDIIDAPMLAWGFYQWADSIPRSTDGFSWVKSETADGLHANSFGQDTLSNRFQNFLLTDKYASVWYARH
ncbi:MAG: hypothetical protein ABJA35_00355 [Parafilimonas sp.]